MTCFEALGISFLGLAVSAAASPVSSVPVYANAALTNTPQKPWKPPLNPAETTPGMLLQEFSFLVELSGSRENVLVFVADIASGVSRHASGIDDDAKEHETQTSQYLDHGKHIFNLLWKH